MKYSTITTLAALAVTVACEGGSSIGGLDAEQFFDVVLTPGEQVPATKSITTATGSAQVVLFPERIEFQVGATSITGITRAHIHRGAPLVAGPVVVTLFQPSAPTGAVNGIFASGTLTDLNLPSGVTLESLKTLLNSGDAYIDVHTTANPNGEIRGQVR